MRFILFRIFSSEKQLNEGLHFHQNSKITYLGVILSVSLPGKGKRNLQSNCMSTVKCKTGFLVKFIKPFYESQKIHGY